ncbi:biofilm regulation protein kinase SiaB [Halopseudomonas sp.]|uniref:biofilm regulation protein kinase SiaB n=1 Tax=Halopseudomonas sp. TaxID=2901191 RepID=UPI0030024E54|tara:strand:+ start:1110 stop:1652 length:543 start_codon:yes stop_codon:yes gene_type:complete
MESIDLFSMRERFNSQQIMLCFNGPISRSLIEEIGNALRNYLSADHAHPSAAMDVFAVYIEMTQNISHYTRTQGWSEQESGATVVVSRDDDGHYVVSAGNIIAEGDGQRLLDAVESLAGLDKAELKAAYKEQLRKPRDAEKSSGAGLGLIDIARKASQPLRARIQPISEGRSFFSLRAVI